MVNFINITIFSVEALPWNLIVEDHWRCGLSIDHIVGRVWLSRHLGCVLLASSLQAHRSADKCLAHCLYSGGVVQAVTFGYLIYWLVLVNRLHTISNGDVAIPAKKGDGVSHIVLTVWQVCVVLTHLLWTNPTPVYAFCLVWVECAGCGCSLVIVLSGTTWCFQTLV